MATLLALFPDHGQGVNSYFWCTPGVEMMTDNPFRGGAINLNMTAFATNTLLETYYDDFLSHVAWTASHTY